MAKTFIPTPLLSQILARDVGVGAITYAKAKAAAQVARGMAPVSSGDYRDGIEADSGLDGGKLIGRVNGKDWKSGFIEFGTANNPPHAVLRRAVESIGLKFRASRQ